MDQTENKRFHYLFNFHMKKYPTYYHGGAKLCEHGWPDRCCVIGGCPFEARHNRKASMQEDLSLNLLAIECKLHLAEQTNLLLERLNRHEETMLSKFNSVLHKLVAIEQSITDLSMAVEHLPGLSKVYLEAQADYEEAKKQQTYHCQHEIAEDLCHLCNIDPKADY